MNAIVTVVGNDKVGIIARVSAFLAERNINIEDISQTVLSGQFVMMMMVDLSGNTKPRCGALSLDKLDAMTCVCSP